MINLLPPEDQIAVKKERRRRLMVAIGVFLFGIISSAIILLTPSYFLLSSQKQNLEMQFLALKKIIILRETEKIESSINALNQKLIFLSNKEGNQRQMSSLLRQISDIRPPTVRLATFYYEKKGGENFFSTEGIAVTRNSFLLFLNSLEKIDGVKNVSSPPSNLLKEENISFKLVIELSH